MDISRLPDGLAFECFAHMHAETNPYCKAAAGMLMHHRGDAWTTHVHKTQHKRAGFFLIDRQQSCIFLTKHYFSAFILHEVPCPAEVLAYSASGKRGHLDRVS